MESDRRSERSMVEWEQMMGPPVRLKRMRELEAENARLKKLLADKSLDYDILKEGRYAL